MYSSLLAVMLIGPTTKSNSPLFKERNASSTFVKGTNL